MNEKPASKTTRVKDGPIVLFDGKLLNRQAMAEKFNCSPLSISKMVHRPNGLPHIRMGGKLWFSPEKALEWFEQQQTQSNPSRRDRKCRKTIE